MTLFTVKSSMPTGKEDPKFGSEYYVQFNEMQDAPVLWYKTQPEAEQEIELEKNNKGQWKKVKKEWNPNQESSTKENSSPKPYAKPAYKDNSDGIKQGMCINNAANFVNNQVFETIPTAEEWAKAVHNYASELYKLVDLTTPVVEQVEVPKDVAAMFGAK